MTATSHAPHAPFQQPDPVVAAHTIGRWYWSAMAVAIVGFFFKVEITMVTTSSDGMGSCSYTDYGALLCAGATAVLAVIGLVANPKRHVSERMPQSAAGVFTVLLLAVAAVHVLHGTGVTGGPCS